MNVCTLQYEEYDSVLGCYAIRTHLLQTWSPWTIPNFNSAEIAFARYIYSSAFRLHKIQWLDVHCIFADSGKTLDV
jgi:hypothetical protein